MEIVDLRQAKNTALYGGKATSLADLLQAGFSVPTGFVVSLDESQEIQPFVDQILELFDGLSADFVAVRSSAIAEDGSSASWAGQLETYLNVTREMLIKKVKLCRQSAHSKRAAEYAKLNHQQSGRVAVIIQNMIASDTSGVAFSVHPVTQKKDQIVIEAVRGLGESLVSGEITPDNYTVSKENLAILDSHISVQTKQLTRDGAGNNVWQTINEAGQKVTNDQIAEVAKTVSEIESHFKHPVDVEWAYEDGQLLILQSRPITTLG